MKEATKAKLRKLAKARWRKKHKAMARGPLWEKVQSPSREASERQVAEVATQGFADSGRIEANTQRLNDEITGLREQVRLLTTALEGIERLTRLLR